LYEFVDRDRLDTFLVDSGRVNGSVVGTDFCPAPEDKELLVELTTDVQLKAGDLSRSERKKHKNQLKTIRAMVERQFPNFFQE